MKFQLHHVNIAMLNLLNKLVISSSNLSVLLDFLLTVKNKQAIVTVCFLISIRDIEAVPFAGS